MKLNQRGVLEYFEKLYKIDVKDMDDSVFDDIYGLKSRDLLAGLVQFFLQNGIKFQQFPLWEQRRVTFRTVVEYCMGIIALECTTDD